MLGQLDMVRHQEVGLLVVALTVTVIVAAVDDIALVPLMTASGVGIDLDVLFADLEHLPWSLQL